MNISGYSKIKTYLIAIVIFLGISILYFSPVLEGKRLKTHDNATWAGGAQELKKYYEETGEDALWTNSMFGGMPGYLISTQYPANLIKYVDKVLKTVPRPASYVGITMFGFFLLLMIFGVNPWIGIIGAIAYGFSSYYFIILAAGHFSKAVAMAYMAPLIAGIVFAFRGKKLLGGALMGISLSLELLAGHLQITYYTLLIVLIFGVVQLIEAFQKRCWNDFLKTTGILIIFAILGVGSNYSRLKTTAEYGKFSIRGKSELTTNKENKTSGLDKDYATQWSYGKLESFTLMIPNFMGGASGGELSKGSETYQVLKKNRVPNANNIIKQLPLYWGPQPFTSGPVYVGAIVCFLFVLGLSLVKGPEKWWLLTATVLSVLLSWGKNFMPLTDFFLDYIPGYNKFRTVSMTLVIAELTIPLLGFLALKKIFNGEISKEEFRKALKWALGITGGFALLFSLIPGIAGDFSSAADAQLPQWLIEPLHADRKALLRSDSIRSLIFILLAAGTLWAFVEKKIKINLAILALGVLVLVDMWPVNRRYLNNDNFVNKREVDVPFKPTRADQEILKDKDPDYRVLNLSVSTFNDASTSYFHHSIGGYHGAKMRRYQELIDYQIQGELQEMSEGLSNVSNQEGVDSLFSQLGVLNMLNTRYIIFSGERAPLYNSKAFGNAWFAKNLNRVKNSDEEMALLGQINLRETALVDERFESLVKNFTPGKDSLASIKLIKYAPNHLVYQSKGNRDQIAVFSEIYYPKGWNAYVDGKKTDYFRTNYVLRGMIIPGGEHKVEFKFEPKSYITGNKISLASSLILLLALFGIVFIEIKKSKRKA